MLFSLLGTGGPKVNGLGFMYTQSSVGLSVATIGASETEGSNDGTPDGCQDGWNDVEGMEEGTSDGSNETVGTDEGVSDSDGWSEGISDGLAEGEEESDGCDDGSSDSEGEIDGTSVGASVFFEYAPVQSAVRQKAWYRMVNFVLLRSSILFVALFLSYSQIV